MKILSSLYAKLIKWSQHPHAPAILAAVSFTESSFFPVPPDVMLISMGLAKTERVLFYTSITFIFSILGAFLGYAIGYYFFEWAHPVITYVGYEAGYEQVKTWFHDVGFWAMAIAGFTPIPFKIFTITAGVVKMNLAAFILGSCVGRASRFYLVGGLLYVFGQQVDHLLHKWIDTIGWVIIVLALVAYIYFHFW